MYPFHLTANLATPTPQSSAHSDHSDAAILPGEIYGDISGDFGENPYLEIGTAFEGYIGSEDTDTVRIRLEAGITYEFGAFPESPYEDGGLEDTELVLRSAEGKVLEGKDDISSDVTASAFVYTAKTTDDFYLTINGDHGLIGNYVMGVIPDAGDDTSSAVPLNRFRSIEGALIGSDTDWYEVSDLDHTMSFSVEGLGDFPATDLELSLYDQNGTLLHRISDAGGAAFRYDFEEAPGRYYLEVGSSTKQGGGQYLLRSMTDPNGGFDASNTWVLEANDPVGFNYSQIIIGDERNLRDVELTAGREYQFDAWGTGSAGLDTPLLEIFDQNGRRLEQSDNDFGAAQITFVPDRSATYFIGVSTEGHDDNGAYRLRTQDITEASPVDPLFWGGDSQLPQDDPIHVWFAPDGAQVNDQGHIYTSWGFDQIQQDRFLEILAEVSTFTDLEFEVTTQESEADFRLVLDEIPEEYEATAFMNPRGETTYSDGIAVFNPRYWDPDNLQKGSYDSFVVAHEFGHGMGLSHPHDGLRMLDVQDDSDLGRNDLNQGPFTVLTYNEYWDGDIANINRDAGHHFGYGALDIAALQDLYGVNDSFAAGNDVYRLEGRSWSQTIWDTGGTDAITYQGGEDIVIDLRPATLDYSPTGGGAVSYVRGGTAGYTIAQGVEIENASTGDGRDVLFGNDLRNTLSGKQGNDRIEGLGGADVISGGAGEDTLLGDAGDDTLRGEDGNDQVWGGDGRDRVFLGLGGDVYFDNAQNGVDGHDTVFGGRGQDTVNGMGGNDAFFGNEGDDLLYGGAGNDSLHGGANFDTLHGNGGNDQVWGGNGQDVAFLGLGDDVFHDDAQTGIDGRDKAYGGLGNDTINGGGGDDTFFGNEGDDLVFGGLGIDAVRGGMGNDTLYGNGGNDRVWGGIGQDTAYLGFGDDVFFDDAENTDDGRDSVFGGPGDDTVNGGGGEDTFFGNNGDDLLIGAAGGDTLQGGADNDILQGKTGNDEVWGGNGQDRAFLGVGDDIFYDNAQNDADGRDTVYGGPGNDTLHSGGGNNTLTGGAGADTFSFDPSISKGLSTITDFEVGIDLMRLTGISFDDLDLVPAQNGVRVEWEVGSVLLQRINPDEISEDSFQFMI